MRRFRVAVALSITFIVMPASTRAQAPASDAPKPSFDVASIKLNKSRDSSSGSSTRPGGRLTVTNETLRQLIRDAYVLQDFQVVGGQGWTSDDRFDIVAKAEGNPDADQIRLMLRSLLAERFHLIVHGETKEMPVYALVRAREDGKPRAIADRIRRRLRRADSTSTALRRAHELGIEGRHTRRSFHHHGEARGVVVIAVAANRARSNGSCRRIRHRSQVDTRDGGGYVRPFSVHRRSGTARTET